MRNLIILTTALLFVFNTIIQAQEILIVEPGLGTLNTAIKEYGADRIYQLKAGAWYQLDGIIENVDYHLQIIGEKPTGDGFPATVQTNVDAGGAVFQRMFDAKGDITLKNVYFVNADLMGNVGMRFINQSKDGARTWLENCIVDPAGIADLVFVASVNTKTYLYDNLILRHGHLNHYWDGQIVSHDAGQTIGLDTLIVENNTIVSAGSGMHNSGFAKKVDNYVRWNHNTIVFHKVNLDWSAWDDEYYFTNNLLFDAAVRPTPHEWNISLPGVDVAKPNFPLIMADTIPAEILPSERIQYVQYNLLHRNPALYALADELNTLIASQGKFVYHKPLMWPIDSINVSREVCMFNNHEYFPMFLYGNTYSNVDPLWEDELIYEYSDNLVNWVSNVARQELGLTAEPANQWKNWHWDLDGDPSINEAWPVFNGRYTNPELLTGSIEGLPLGDLNWYPAAKALWQEHKDQIEAHMRAGNVEKLIITNVNPVTIPKTITIFPNPARDIITINIQADKIIVFNITGSVVKSASFTNQINVSDLAGGLYYVRINKGNEIHTQKIIVVK
jgi:hypothetical protein